jgi:hypothetical protein
MAQRLEGPKKLMPSKNNYANMAIKESKSCCAPVTAVNVEIQPQHITGFRILASMRPEVNV